MIKKYKGYWGNFQYDDTEFQLERGCLHYIGAETDGRKIKIPEGVTNCDSMFKGCNIVTPPVIPAGVVMCNFMFADCSSLVEPPVIPEGVVDCRYMFRGCTSLVEAPAIPEGVAICTAMFSDCSSLVEAPTIPAGVKKDCDFMFADCKSLTETPEIPEGVTICSYMFYKCSFLRNYSLNPDGRGGMYQNCFSLLQEIDSFVDTVREQYDLQMEIDYDLEELYEDVY